MSVGRVLHKSYVKRFRCFDRGSKCDISMISDLTLITLGSNLKTTECCPFATLRAAMEMLESAGTRLLEGCSSRSVIYRTPAFPAGNGPDFANAAIRFEGTCDPEAALALCHEIEAAFGRERTVRWGPRSLDVDLIAVGETILPDRATVQLWRELPLARQMERTPETLLLPHPRFWERSFVLVPLADVAPDWVDPISGQTVRALLDARPAAERAEVVPYTP